MIWGAAPSKRSSLPATTDQLSPFVATLRADVESSLRALLALPPTVALAWEAHCLDREAGTGVLKLQVGRAPDQVTLGLTIAARAGGSVLDVERPRLAYRDLGEVSRNELRLVRHLLAAAERAPRSASERVLAAVPAFWAYADVDDWMYRQINDTGRPCATVRLGFRCNQRCGFCWQGRHWPEPPSELYARWIDEIAALGILSLTFSGGEPTLHPDLPALVRRAASKEPAIGVGLQTNAIRLRNVLYLNSLLDAGLQVVLVSYHSADPAASDAMTGTRGSHRLTVEGIEACLRHGRFRQPEVRLNCLVERANVAGLEAHARDIVERFVTPFPEHPVTVVEYSYPNQSYDRAHWRQAVVPLDEVRSPLSAAARVLRAAGVRVELFSGCGFPACAVSEAPELVLRVDLGLLDVKDLEGRTWGAACARCALRDACLGLRHEYVEVHGERGLAPFDESPGGRR